MLDPKWKGKSPCENTTPFTCTASDEKETRFYTIYCDGQLLEDDFTNDINAPIEIVFPRFVSVIRGVEKRFQLITRGPVTLALITPFILLFCFVY